VYEAARYSLLYSLAVTETYVVTWLSAATKIFWLVTNCHLTHDFASGVLTMPVYDYYSESMTISLYRITNINIIIIL
jgi:hypothetical protein